MLPAYSKSSKEARLECMLKNLGNQRDNEKRWMDCQKEGEETETGKGGREEIG